MEENNVKSTLESSEPRSPEPKNYRAPVLTEYGDVRELTQLNPSGRFSDGGVIAATESSLPQ